MTRPVPRSCLVCLLAVACTIAAASAEAGPAGSAAPAPGPPAAKRYRLQIEDAGLPELVKAIMAITGKRFVLGGGLPVIKASLYAPDEVTAEEAYQAFLTVLASNGLTVVPRGPYLVIVPAPGYRK